MRNALIEVLLKLNEDKQYDIATALCRQLGYKMVQIEPITLVEYARLRTVINPLMPTDESGESAGFSVSDNAKATCKVTGDTFYGDFAIFSNGADQNGD